MIGGHDIEAREAYDLQYIYFSRIPFDIRFLTKLLHLQRLRIEILSH